MTETSNVIVGDRRIRGTDENEAKGLSNVTTDAAFKMGKEGIFDYEVFEGSTLFARVGTRGRDIIYHIVMSPFPAEHTFRELLAQAFMNTVGNIDGVEASWVDTSDFEDHPNMWAVRVLKGVFNPLARDKYLQEVMPELDRLMGA